METVERRDSDRRGHSGEGRRLLEDLFRTRRRELYLHAYGILRDGEDANDTLQDAFVRAVCHVERLRTRNDPYRWIRRIVTKPSMDSVPITAPCCRCVWSTR